ncbi:MAG TPA: methyltransferase domain-containing protein [Thermoanaerobaculia bacterium]|jgi:SAM-dependent methyltransferase|nr:methyltransferase domain-containing protein [Thermoanaerobaculia bacterium]
MTQPAIHEQLTEEDAERLRFIREGQLHCDYFLPALADPRGKSVLVVGAGAGTEMLWCLRQGAREVVGIDILVQRPQALARAVEEMGIRPAPPFSILPLRIEEAHTLGRRFDLVLSNNVFEHLGDLRRAFEVCASLVEPGTGRVAIFTDPLYYSSAGSHLPVEPWEHLWAAPEPLRQRVLGAVPPHHALHRLDLPEYLFSEISLNRMRLVDLLEAVRASDLVMLNLRLLRDRRLQDLPAHLDRLEGVRRGEQVAVTDLAVEGIAIELLRLGESPLAEPPVSAEEIHRARQGSQLQEEMERQRRELEEPLRQAREEAARTRAESLRHQQTAAELERVLRSVEASWSFRLGRLLTAPARWARGSGRRP